MLGVPSAGKNNVYASIFFKGVFRSFFGSPSKTLGGLYSLVQTFTVCNVSFTVLFVPNETSHLNDFRHVI